MIRACPKCGDYYADASLAFCLTDGTPLVNLDPQSERWSEGARVIEEKGNALRKQKRRLKWRRVMMTAMTMLIVAMVVYVVAVNTYLYLKPKTEEVVQSKPLLPTTEPAGGPTDSPTPSVTGEPTSTPDTQPTVSPTSPPRSPTPTPTPTPTLTHTPTPTPGCSDREKSSARESIIRRYKGLWQSSIERDRNSIIPKTGIMGVGNIIPTLVPIRPELKFSKTCERADVTVNYEWRLTPRFNGVSNSNGPTNFNALPRAGASVRGTRSFVCNRTGEVWHCP